MENPIKMDDLGVPGFLETPKYLWLWIIIFAQPIFFLLGLGKPPTYIVMKIERATWSACDGFAVPLEAGSCSLAKNPNQKPKQVDPKKL